MTRHFRLLFAFLLFAIPLLLAGPDVGSAQPMADSTDKDVLYVPTAPSVVRTMLEVGGVTEGDVVYDLGSGDGRIPIMAAKEFGAWGVGLEIDSALVAEARREAQMQGLFGKVKFLQKDLFNADLSKATVVTLYLGPGINVMLRPKLLRELDPGDRIVSHDFRMGEWAPDSTVAAGRGNTGNETVYLWIVPEKVPEDLKDTPTSREQTDGSVSRSTRSSSSNQLRQTTASSTEPTGSAGRERIRANRTVRSASAP
jgi:SAM-dependent methyltransferase